MRNSTAKIVEPFQITLLLVKIPVLAPGATTPPEGKLANEPTVPDELRAMQNVVLLPHIGSASVVTRNAMDQLVVDNLKSWFAGKPPLTPVAETPVKGR